MPPRGVKKGTKRARQYEHIKDSLKEQGGRRARRRRSPHAPSTRSAHATARRASRRGSSRDESPRAGAEASLHRKGPRGRTKDQLYEEARDQGRQGPLEDDEGRARPGRRGQELTPDVARECSGSRYAPTVSGSEPSAPSGLTRGTTSSGWRMLGAWSKDIHYLPYATVSVREGAVNTSSLTVLGTGPTAFLHRAGRAPVYRHRGGRFGQGGNRVIPFGGDAGWGKRDDERYGLRGFRRRNDRRPRAGGDHHGPRAGGSPHGSAAPRGDDHRHRRRCHLPDRRPLRRDLRRLDDARRPARGRSSGSGRPAESWRRLLDPHIRRIFEITLLDRVFALHETREEASERGRPRSRGPDDPQAPNPDDLNPENREL